MKKVTLTYFFFNLQSNLSQCPTLGPPKSGCCSKGGRWSKGGSKQVCSYFSWDVDSGWLLLAGGHCSMVVFHTGLWKSFYSKKSCFFANQTVNMDFFSQATISFVFISLSLFWTNDTFYIKSNLSKSMGL